MWDVEMWMDCVHNAYANVSYAFGHSFTPPSTDDIYPSELFAFWHLNDTTEKWRETNRHGLFVLTAMKQSLVLFIISSQWSPSAPRQHCGCWWLKYRGVSQWLGHWGYNYDPTDDKLKCDISKGLTVPLVSLSSPFSSITKKVTLLQSNEQQLSYKFRALFFCLRWPVCTSWYDQPIRPPSISTINNEHYTQHSAAQCIHNQTMTTTIHPHKFTVCVKTRECCDLWKQ